MDVVVIDVLWAGVGVLLADGWSSAMGGPSERVDRWCCSCDYVGARVGQWRRVVFDAVAAKGSLSGEHFSHLNVPPGFMHPGRP